MPEALVKVVVPAPLPPLTYRVPSSWSELPRPGTPVIAPLRNRMVSGVVLETIAGDASGVEKIRELLEPSTDLPFFNPSLLRCLTWLSQYYHYPAGEVLRSLLPPNPKQRTQSVFSLRSDAQAGKLRGAKLLAALEVLRGGPSALEDLRPQAKRLVELGLAEEQLVPEAMAFLGWEEKRKSLGPVLTTDQSAALEEIDGIRTIDPTRAVLLEGITGSGKTEIYLRLAEKVLEEGKSVLVVVPEIALTPQLVSRFQRRLGRPMATLHSGLSDGERSRQWFGLAQGKLPICIGARSAVLAPMENVGLVIVDEEHDGALKQEDRLRYHARDLALVRAKDWNCTTILGSATPSLETLWNVRSGKFHHIKLRSRASGQNLPQVRIVDMRREPKDWLIGSDLMEAIRGNYNRGEQTMLLLNRRGTASFCLCRQCGSVPQCPRCSVTLTFYMGKQKLVCHYCNYSKSIEAQCESCGAKDQWQEGTAGTEALEMEVKSRLPKLRHLRIDRESTERKGELERALSQIQSGEVDLVIGTQMIAKGHDFPNVTLVGIVQADTSLQFPDFRATERAFQLFTQMAGRAGRSEKPGQVILQTFNPAHPVIQCAQQHDVRGFSEGELLVRKNFHYPPFIRMCRIVIQGKSEGLVVKSCDRLASLLTGKESHWPKLEVLGPAPATISKIKDRFRWNIILKHERSRELHLAIAHLSKNFPAALSKGVDAIIDVDPQSLM